MLGYVPAELISKYSGVTHEGRMVKGSFVAPDLSKFQLTRDQHAELSKLDGAPLGDPMLDRVIGNKLGKIDTPFQDAGADDEYDMAFMVSSGDSIMNEVNFEDPMKDSLSAIPQHMLMSLSSGEGAVGVVQPAGFSRETQAILDKQR